MYFQAINYVEIMVLQMMATQKRITLVYKTNNNYKSD